MPRSSSSVTAPAAQPSPAWFRLKRLFRGGRPDAEARSASPRPGIGARPGRPLPRLSDYVPQHVIARNDRATIHRASERATGALVALKTVHLGRGAEADRGLWRERFLRESAAAARLEHEFIVRVRAGGVQGEGAALTGWLAMEWVHGTDLSCYATPDRLLPEDVVLGIGQRVALALDFAHAAGVVHRDIKPSNVLFDPTTGTVKVTDFGSARVSDSEATRSGLIMGTPAYMAPEQLAGAEVSAQSDLYALGVTMFELLTGQRPFEAESMGDLLGRIAHGEPPRLRDLRPDLPPLLEQVVARLLAKEPGRRQPGGRQVALELKLARAHCQAAAAAAAATGWADTAPCGELGEDPPNVDPETAAFQGTILDRSVTPVPGTLAHSPPSS